MPRVLIPKKDPMIGMTLGDRYRITGRIGAGAVADVYLAEQETLGRRRVAVRVLKLGLVTLKDEGEIHRQRFLREAELISLFRGPAVARILDGGVTQDSTNRPYLVQELIQGKSLAHHVEACPLPWGRAVDICLQLGDALSEMHAYGLVYRDLSPDNIALEEVRALGPMARLYDFSHATVEGILGLDGSQGSEHILGTPGFSAVELAGSPATRAADVFSLAAILYFCLTGIPPLTPVPTNWPGYVDALRRDPRLPRVPVSKLASVPKGLDSILEQALAPDPHARFQNIVDLTDMLHPLAEPWSGPGTRRLGPAGGNGSSISGFFRKLKLK